MGEEAFKREDRYIVIKRKDLSREAAMDLGFDLALHNVRERECVVVEADWPEYEPVWAMIEARMKGAALARECPVSPLPSGKHQVDTSMESGPNNCFFCEQPMPRFASKDTHDATA